MSHVMEAGIDISGDYLKVREECHRSCSEEKLPRPIKHNEEGWSAIPKRLWKTGLSGEIIYQGCYRFPVEVSAKEKDTKKCFFVLSAIAVQKPPGTQQCQHSSPREYQCHFLDVSPAPIHKQTNYSYDWIPSSSQTVQTAPARGTRI